VAAFDRGLVLALGSRLDAVQLHEISDPMLAHAHAGPG
jgi:hypothetical protein